MNKKKFINRVQIFVFIIALLFGIIYVYKINLLNNDSVNNKEKELKNLSNKVEKIYEFPNSEIPTVATVSDPEALKDKIFFLNSKEGDKVLFFPKAGKALLYRPSIEKIIDITIIKSNLEN